MKYHCLLCENIFHSYEEIREHMKSEHNSPFACKGCHVFYESNSEFMGLSYLIKKNLKLIQKYLNYLTLETFDLKNIMN